MPLSEATKLSGQFRLFKASTARWRARDAGVRPQMTRHGELQLAIGR
jgi:hypothetical protein